MKTLFKEFRSPYTREMYSRLCPKVDQPTYTESDVLEKLEELEVTRQQRRSDYFKKHFPLYVLKASVVVGVLLSFFVTFFGDEINQLCLTIVNHTWPEGQRPTDFKVELLSGKFFMLWAMYTLFFGIPFDLTHRWTELRKTKYHEAEFLLRLELTKEQFDLAIESGDEEAAHQYWMYCDSANPKSTFR